MEGEVTKAVDDPAHCVDAGAEQGQSVLEGSLADHSRELPSAVAEVPRQFYCQLLIMAPPVVQPYCAYGRLDQSFTAYESGDILTSHPITWILLHNLLSIQCAVLNLLES